MPTSSSRRFRFLFALTWVGATASIAACTLDQAGRGEPHSTCGNGRLDEAEACDADLFRAKKTCLDVGFTHGRLGCDAKCQLDSTGCHTCGNGVREGTEDCDGSDLAGHTCKTAVGSDAGKLGCTSQCRWDPTKCSTCGNATIETGEVCDGFVPSTHTCMTEAGHESGQLFCSASCSIVVSQCHTCGDGVIDGPEKCDGQALGGMNCVSLGHDGGTLRCNAACDHDDSQCVKATEDWYDDRWLYRRPVLVEQGWIDEDLADFPLLVSLTDPELAQHVLSSDEIVFTDADGETVLPHEIEAYDGATGGLLAWVKLPHLGTTIPARFFVYYGNEAPPPHGSGQVWSNGFTAVWHLNDMASDESAGAPHVDSATGQHPGAQHGNHDVAGKIGRAQSFDGLDDYVELVGADAIVLGDADCTVSAWVRTTSVASISLLRKAPDIHADGDKMLGLTGGRAAVDHGWVGYLATMTTVNDGTWHHIAWTQRWNGSVDLDDWVMYVDGAPNASAEFATKPDVDGHMLRLGDRTLGSNFPSPWDGEVDELRVSRVARSEAWVSASYRNQHAPESLVTLGPEETILNEP